MEWTRDVSAGDWLQERIDDPWRGTMHDVVPRGFEAYARVFHPASVQEIPGGRMPSIDEWEADHARLSEQIIDRPLSWREAAAMFGTTFESTARWESLTETEGAGGMIVAPDGRWVNAPMLGELDRGVLAAVSGILSAHTTTPDAGFAALWEGQGGLVGHLGLGPSRTFFQVGDPDDAVLQHHNAMLGNSAKDVWNNVFRKPTWQEGILSKEISDGPRLRLPEREYVLFQGGASEFARDDWWLDAPWRDRPAEAHGFAPDAVSPNLIWPEDHAWVLVTEIDVDSTIVAGSAELIGALVADPRLEAAAIPGGTALGA